MNLNDMKQKNLFYVLMTASITLILFNVFVVDAQPPQPITVTSNETFLDALVVINRTGASFIEWFPSTSTRSTAVVYFTNYTTTHATLNHSYSWGYDNGTGDLTWPENNTVGYLARTANYSGTNLTATIPYGEMWNYTSAGFPFTTATAGVYYNMTGFIEGLSNGFSFTNAAVNEGGSYLTAQVSGVYSVHLTMSGEGATAGGEYGISVAKNFDEDWSRQCYTNQDGTETIEDIAVNCHIPLDVGDTVNVKVEDEASPTKEFDIHSMNLNLHRIGDI